MFWFYGVKVHSGVIYSSLGMGSWRLTTNRTYSEKEKNSEQYSAKVHEINPEHPASSEESLREYIYDIVT